MEEWRDETVRRWKQVNNVQFAMYKFKQTTMVADGVAARVAGDRTIPGGAQDLTDAQETFELGPEHVLLTAALASDLRARPDVNLQSVLQHVVAFTWQHHPVQVFINAETHLPTAVEWKRAYPAQTFWNAWGDVTTRVYYSMWWLAEGDVRYPLQLDYVRNGLPDRRITVTDLEINEPISDGEFTIPNDVKTVFNSKPLALIDDRPLPMQGASEIADGVFLISGAWNTTIVKQPDGLVVIEAPISSGYSAKVIQEARRRYPGLPIKVVISTSDSWPHIGGVREYVAHGVPVYVLDRSLPLLKRLVAAPHAERPDTLACAPRAARFVSVRGKTVIGSGANQLEIYPIHGDTSERQMMVYFPGRKLLYGSDVFQRNGTQTAHSGLGEFVYPQTVSELRDAVRREDLDVETFFMMHIPPTPWSHVMRVRGGPIPQS